MFCFIIGEELNLSYYWILLYIYCCFEILLYWFDFIIGVVYLYKYMSVIEKKFVNMLYMVFYMGLIDGCV